MCLGTPVLSLLIFNWCLMGHVEEQSRVQDGIPRGRRAQVPIQLRLELGDVQGWLFCFLGSFFNSTDYVYIYSHFIRYAHFIV